MGSLYFFMLLLAVANASGLGRCYNSHHHLHEGTAEMVLILLFITGGIIRKAYTYAVLVICAAASGP